MFMKGESYNRKIRELRRTQRIGKIGESCRNGRIGEFYVTIHILLLEVIFSDLPHETLNNFPPILRLYFHILRFFLLYDLPLRSF